MRDTPGNRTFFCFKCRSWRHAGECARFVTQRDFKRLETALKDHHLANIVFLVLTYDPATAPKSLDAQYRELLPRWAALEQALRRGLRREGFPGVGKFKYAAYVEGHKNGRPHVNVVIVSQALSRYLRAHPPSESDLDENASHRGKRAPRWFRTLAVHAGFGAMASLRHAQTKKAVASYVTKFEGNVTHPTLGGEVTKMAQLPIWAPRGFRRSRASPGFLPPIASLVDKDPRRTGELELCPTDEVMLERQRAAYAELKEHLWPTSTRSGP